MTPGLLAALIVSLMSAVPRQQDENRRDASVYEAVLRHTILPESQRFNAAQHRRAVSRVLVVDQTYAVCGAADQTLRWLGCLSEDDLRRFREPLPRVGGFIFEQLLSEGTRVELAASLRDRNGANHPFAARELDIVEPVPPGDLPVNASQQLPMRDFAMFSRPGYSQDGRAVVHARYVCGSLCGYVWLFLVDQRADGWEVADVYMLWIS